MCYFITIGLPEGKAEFLEDHVPRGFHIAAIANASVLQQRGSGFCTWPLMSGGCSCALFYGSATETEDDRQAESRSRDERLRRKHKKMGWSAAKIERALVQHTEALARHAKTADAHAFVGLRGDVQRFLGELAATVGQLAVLAHWYDEDLQEARFACKQGAIVPAEIAIAEGLQLGTDEIVRIGAS